MKPEQEKYIKEREKEILHYILKNEEYVNNIFFDKKIDIDRIIDNNIKIIAKIAINYYKRYNSKLIEKELINIIDVKYNNKEISKEQHAAIWKTFDEVTNDYVYDLDENQYDRVLQNWIESFLAVEIEKTITKEITKIKDYKSFEVIENLINNLEYLKVYSKTANDDFFDITDIIKDYDEQIQDYERRRNENLSGIPTGINDVDSRTQLNVNGRGMFNGFENGTLNLIGGVTGQGKSTLAINIGKNIFEKYDKKVLSFSLEMSQSQWTRKYNSIYLRKSYGDLMTGDKEKISDEEFEKIKKRLEKREEEFKNKKGEYKVICAPSYTYSFSELMSKYQTKIKDFKPDIIFIDQLSLLHKGKYHNIDHRIALGMMTKEIRACAKKMNIPIVLIVQANRAAVKYDKTGKRYIDVNLENIEDSDKVGQDCDSFLAISRISTDNNKMIIRIAKQREGEVGDIEIMANLEMALIFDDSNSIPTACDEDDTGLTETEVDFNDIIDDDEDNEEQNKDPLSSIIDVDDDETSNDSVDDIIDDDIIDDDIIDDDILDIPINNKEKKTVSKDDDEEDNTFSLNEIIER